MKPPKRSASLAQTIRIGLCSGVLIGGTAQAQYPAIFPLYWLIGQNGFRLDGVSQDDLSGISVSSAGDINGDGIDDLVVGATGADPFNLNDAGSSYVVFGLAFGWGFGSPFELGALNGSNGFRLDGQANGDHCGRSVAPAGDINNDGIGDLIITANRTDPGGRVDAGSAYVLFGRPTTSGFDAVIALSALNGSDGFRLDGVAAGDSIGRSAASAGDINGDGIDDLIVGASLAGPEGHPGTGRSYVVFGRPSALTFSSVINLSTLNGSNGFRLDGAAWGDRSGRSLAGLGDINGDGLDDVVIGAHYAMVDGINEIGSSYVVFGRSGENVFQSSINLGSLNGSNGFRLNGRSESEYSGRSVASAGDVNGDGVNDLIIGAPGAGESDFGYTYVVFGRSAGGGFGSALSLSTLNGNDGFTLVGPAYSQSGFAVAAAGDFNGDGVGDLIIGAPDADPIGRFDAGSSYVLFGRASPASFEPYISLDSLNGANGFRVDGVTALDGSGYSVAAAGDINGDGLDDLIIGAWTADPAARNYAGSSYVLFGARMSSIFSDGLESP